MYERIDICPCCNSKDFENYIICDDYSVSKESFAITKCKNCGLLITSPRPDVHSIGTYYESKDYISHTNKANGLLNFIYKKVRNQTLRNKFQLIDKLTLKKKILDYGCGTGEWLNYNKQKGWKTLGIEPNPKAKEHAINQYGLEVYSDIQSIPNKKFSIITLWHVLEHVHDLNKLLHELHSKLSKKGKLIIAVPNHDCYDRKFYKEYWAAYDVPRHLYHFNQQTLLELSTFHNFKLERTIPMKFDSYYVSMLSEKNKTRSHNYIKSIIIGWLSNRWAKKNENNYSSLTYIFSKT